DAPAAGPACDAGDGGPVADVAAFPAFEAPDRVVAFPVAEHEAIDFTIVRPADDRVVDAFILAAFRAADDRLVEPVIQAHFDTAHQHVVAGAAIDHVGTLAADHHVRIAIETGRQDVVAALAEEAVAMRRTRHALDVGDDVVAVAAIHLVEPGAALDHVVAGAAIQIVVSGAADENVVAGLTEDVVLAVA